MPDRYPTFSAQAVANRFLELARSGGTQLTNMQLQKLVYLSHGFHLGLTGQPLINDKVKAWQFGPVIRELYEELRKYGNGEVTANLSDRSTIPPGTAADSVINHVWKGYGRMSGMQLSDLTHLPGTPWDRAWNGGLMFEEIPSEWIRGYYHDRLSHAGS